MNHPRAAALLAALLALAPAAALGQHYPSMHLAGATIDANPVFGACTGYIYGNAAAASSCATNIPASALSGALPAANEPAHTGDVANAAGSLALTIQAGAVTSGDLAAGAAAANLGFTALNKASNLSDLASPSSARTNLGLGALATVVPGANVASGLANAATGSGAPVFAVSPALTGSPTAPTQSGGDSTTKIATDAFVAAAVSAGGGGTVDSVTAGAGLSASGVGASGGAITNTGTLTHVEPVNPQSSGYAIASGDNAKQINMTCSAACADTLSHATTSGFTAGFSVDIVNNGSDLVTITPTTSTINGLASIVLCVGQGVHIVSDGTNYEATFGAIPGGRCLLATLTASTSATLSDTTHITAQFDQYEIVLEDLQPSYSGTACEIEVYANGAYQTSGYAATGPYTNSGGLLTMGSWTGVMPCSESGRVVTGGVGVTGAMRLYHPSIAGLPKAYTGQFTYTSSSSPPDVVLPGGSWTNTTYAVTGFELLFGVGNIVSGTVKIYGLN